MSTISYEIIRSIRRTVALQIMPDGRVVVRSPEWMSAAEIDRFVQSKSDWLEKHLTRRAAQPAMPVLTAEEVRALADRALQSIPARVAYFAPRVGVTYGRITIRNQRTRWGSCSSRGNLNFNCLLMLTPADVMDYVVVHELCHRKELNHSGRFWAEVERVLPEYRQSRQWLKEHGDALIARLGS